jgi:phenylalanine-4-hydroxylase
VLNDLQDMLQLAKTEFAPYYAALDSGPSYKPGDVLGTDRVFHRGTGSYHRARLKP